MPSDFELAQLEKVAAVIYIIASFIVILSADKTQQSESQKLAPSAPPTPTQLAVTASWLFLAGNIIFGLVAGVRLKKVEAGIVAGTEKGSAEPNVYITFGWILGILGSVLRVIGTELRAKQQQPVTIL